MIRFLHDRMPRRSNRSIQIRRFRKLVQQRQFLSLLRTIQGQQSFSEDFIDLIYLRRYQLLKDNRYTYREPYRTGLSHVMFQLDIHAETGDDGRRPFLTDLEFLQKYRMTRRSFSKLVSLTKDHPVFNVSASPSRKQIPASYQLMIFLKYLGTEGGGNSNSDLRNLFHTGRGSNELYKARAAEAIRSLRPTYYYWPDVEERQSICARIKRICRLPNCVGFIDGTMTPLYSKPRRPDAADYFGRKQRYALSTMVICDDRRMIRYYLAGWPGSCHDNRIYRNSRIATSPGHYFSVGEYLAADSAFEPSQYIVPAFKKPNGHTLPRECENFNKCLSTGRVISEHAIGIWKDNRK